MITIYEDIFLSFKVKWDQDSRFLVFQDYIDGSSIEVDSFEVETSAPMMFSDASLKAKEYCDMIRGELA